MSIHSIQITNFRNLQQTSVTLDPHLNFVTGLNASGKTSLLEALYFLSTGRSFRTRKFENIIKRSEDVSDFVLFGNIYSTSAATSKNAVGIKKSKISKTEIKVNGDKINSASKLAYLSPVIVIDPLSFDLLNGAPKSRRKFMDWGVFHVEHAFTKVWNSYIYCLKQRNSILRTGKIDRIQMNAWDRQIVQLGEQVDAYRSAYIKSYINDVESILAKLGLQDLVKIKYYKGWDKQSSLSDVFQQSLAKDMERRYTQYGPQRADIKLTVSGKPISNLFSRGQQKLVVIALHLAHILSLLRNTKKRTVVLIDDITAELDNNNLRLIFDLLQGLDTQVVCTLLNIDELDKTFAKNKIFNMFHVEHGIITAQNKSTTN